MSFSVSTPPAKSDFVARSLGGDAPSDKARASREASAPFAELLAAPKANSAARESNVAKPSCRRAPASSARSSNRPARRSEAATVERSPAKSPVNPADALQNAQLPPESAPEPDDMTLGEVGAPPTTEDGQDFTDLCADEPTRDADNQTGELPSAATTTRSFGRADILARQFATMGREAGDADDAHPDLAEPTATLGSEPALRESTKTSVSTLRSSALTAEADEKISINTDTDTQADAGTDTNGAGESAASATSGDSSPFNLADLTLRAAEAQASALAEANSALATERAEKASSARREKIAAVAGKNVAGKFSAKFDSDKNFLSSDEEVVAKHVSGLGTDVAKSGADMIDLTSHRSSALDAPQAAPLVVLETGRAEQVSEKAFVLELSNTAQRAVEAVLTAADRFSTGERNSVNLHFSVGGNDLTVRVELRAQEVYATFRTDSPELRSALAQEWHSVTSGSEADRSLRFAAPVIAANSDQSDSSSFSSFAGGESSSRQRENGARRSSDESFTVVAGARGTRSQSTSAVTTSESSPVSALSSSLFAASTSARRLFVHA